MSSTVYGILVCILILSEASSVISHGYMIEPVPRGMQSAFGMNPYNTTIHRSALTDYRSHFPAGDRDATSSIDDQSRAGGYNWTPFQPWKREFKWRAGVCGDVKYGNDHRRGGKYYNNGFISRRYVAESIVNFEVAVAANHNGYFEFYICNVALCGGKIAQKCFRKSACKRLRRARTPECERGTSKLCGPIDRSFDSRWYLPCSSRETRGGGRHWYDHFGARESMRYHLPKRFHCEHCVIQWYWTAADRCNPPGVIEYFTGPDKPQWGMCRGGGGAQGGVNLKRAVCGGNRFPEEYFLCADVRIVPKWAGLRVRKNPVKEVVFYSVTYSSKKVVKKLRLRNYIDISGVDGISIEAVTDENVGAIEFFVKIGGVKEKVGEEKLPPYYIGGYRGTYRGNPNKWTPAPLNQPFLLVIKAGSYYTNIHMYLNNK